MAALEGAPREHRGSKGSIGGSQAYGGWRGSIEAPGVGSIYSKKGGARCFPLELFAYLWDIPKVPYPYSNNDKTFFKILEFCDTPPNPKSKNLNLDYHTITTSREVMKTSENIIKV
jgi:hypothetical protein